MTFGALGIESGPAVASLTLYLRNPYDHDTSGFDTWKTLMYTFAALSLPLFWGNDDSSRPRGEREGFVDRGWMSKITLGIGAGMAIAAVTYASININKWEGFIGTIYIHADPFSGTLNILLLLLSLGILCFFLWLCGGEFLQHRGGRDRGAYFFEHKLAAYKAHCRKLVPMGSKRFRSLRWLNFKHLRGGEKTLKELDDEAAGEPPRKCFGLCKGSKKDTLDIKAEDVGRIRATKDLDEDYYVQERARRSSAEHLQRKRRVAQLRPGFSLSLRVLQNFDRTRPSSIRFVCTRRAR